MPTVGGRKNIKNQDLTWETSSQTNVGLDFALLNNRLNLSLDYYYKYTKDMQVQEMYSPSRRGVLTLYALPDTVEQGLTEAQAYNIVWDAFNEIQQRCPTAMVFYGQDTGYKLQKSHDELGVLLPLKEFEHNILDHLEQVDGIVLRCREEMIHQAGKDSLPL